MAPAPRLILGLDPGLAITGFSVLCETGGRQGYRLLDAGVVRTPAGTPLPQRLSLLRTELTSILDEHPVQAAGVERLFFAANRKTAIDVAQARGVALELLASRRVPVFEYTPNQIKKAVTGSGRATKKDIQIMVSRLLGLVKPLTQDDATDAVAVALSHLCAGARPQ